MRIFWLVGALAVVGCTGASGSSSSGSSSSGSSLSSSGSGSGTSSGSTGGSSTGGNGFGSGALSGALAFSVVSAGDVEYSEGFSMVGLFDFPVADCPQLDNLKGNLPPGEHRIVSLSYAGTPTITPGVYGVSSGYLPDGGPDSQSFVVTYADTFDDGGSNETDAISGSVNVSAVTSSEVDATFDVFLSDGTGGQGSELSGSFAAPRCPSN